MAHKHALMVDEIAELRTTIEAATKRKSRKRKYLQKEGTLTIEEEAKLILEKGGGEQETVAELSRSSGAADAAPRQRRCGRCGRIEHNARTCRILSSDTSDTE
jgi:hypothetical protein